MIHIDTNIGQTHGGVNVREVTSVNGQVYWKASCEIDSIFGVELEEGSGPVMTGIGATKEQALERMREECRKFNESLF